MAALHVLRVFTDERGQCGNELGAFLDAAAIEARRRQEIATELGYSETVFVDDPGRAELRIFTPATELPFAGHPLVGSAWLLRREGVEVRALRPPAGEVGVRFEEEMTYISADPAWSPSFEQVQLPDAGVVEALEGPPGEGDDVYAWAWGDEEGGEVRARSFAPGFGIPEDEATGAAALALCARLARPLTVLQGRGSMLLAFPLEDGRAEVGGRVVLDEVRDFPA